MAEKLLAVIFIKGNYGPELFQGPPKIKMSVTDNHEKSNTIGACSLSKNMHFKPK